MQDIFEYFVDASNKLFSPEENAVNSWNSINEKKSPFPRVLEGDIDCHNSVLSKLARIFVVQVCYVLKALMLYLNTNT